MSPMIDKITTKLLDLVNEKNLLGLNDNVERSSRRLKETSMVVESKVIGRERDKEALLGKLLGSESLSSQTTNFNVEWELLQRPFTVEAPGSKVLVTTRKTTVESEWTPFNLTISTFCQMKRLYLRLLNMHPTSKTLTM
ncbi:hypothetical protein E3N88_31890 [Mikania micrantha]|uniref:Uncharacterized protein n=1 Tax=Mikania micrantha TaxID=192012 RepID=A0A5N6M842_9ASTR|nr:hypothetical protein E3N88_31890 [Mikania micrantha]